MDELVVNVMNTPVEAVETEFPVRVESYGLAQDSGGPGTFRGGLGVRRQWRILGDELVINLRTDRFKFSSPGIFGAKPAHPSAASLQSESAPPRPLTSKVAGLRLKKGDLLSMEFGGGGGWGDPRDRAIRARPPGCRARLRLARGGAERLRRRLYGRSQRRRRGDGALRGKRNQGGLMKLRIGIDVGGTFTDLAAFDEDGGALVAVANIHPIRRGRRRHGPDHARARRRVRRGLGRAGAARLDRGAQHHARGARASRSALSPRAAFATSTRSAGNGAATRCSTSSRRRPRCCCPATASMRCASGSITAAT